LKFSSKYVINLETTCVGFVIIEKDYVSL